MVRSAEIIEKIQHALSKEEWLIIEAPILELKAQQVRKARKILTSQINHILVETSLNNDRPGILLALPDIQDDESNDLFPRLVRQYIATARDDWLKIIYSLLEKTGKKSSQSQIFAMVARDLIDAGVSGRNPALIENGMEMLDHISFRKYRSDIMIDIIPLLINWAVVVNNKKYLCISLGLIDEIGDISKRSVIHSELAKALATIATRQKDRDMFFYSIRSAAGIHQKIRRQTCIASLIGLGAVSGFSKEMDDIVRFADNFPSVTPEAQLEIISALTVHLLEQTKDKEQILSVLQNVCTTRPSATGAIVIDLLKKAEQTGEYWYLTSALGLQQQTTGSSSYPLREIIHAAIAVAAATGNMQVLTDLIPVIEKNSNTAGISRTFLQFSQIMLSSGNFDSALALFGRISRETDTIPQYTEILTRLLKEGFLRDCIPVVSERLLRNLEEPIVTNAVSRAAVELAKDAALETIVAHIRSMKDLVLLHPQHDHLVHECILILGDRGFFNIHDPGILIRLAESIGDQEIKERAISSILIRIAKIGVQLKNRDYLQRAVGLTCAIDGQVTRSATLGSIIDETSVLAAQQGDLDLLLRMRAWSSSLLEPDLAVSAMANIIEGIIKYAINRKSSDALEEAYTIVKDINDQTIRAQLSERIAETFVRIGCIILKEPSSLTPTEDFPAAKRSFSRGLDIIRQDSGSSQVSLKIAGIIDIIVTYSRQSSNPDFMIPLAMYAAEISNPYERDAMMSRIISGLLVDVIQTSSTDPYEIMAFLLLKNDRRREDPDIIGLISRIMKMISDPFAKLSGLCSLAESIIRPDDVPGSKRVLQEIADGLPDLAAEDQKVLLLADLAILACRIDTGTASGYLLEGIDRLEKVETGKDTAPRQRVVFALARVHASRPEKRWVDLAMQVAGKITEPPAYISVLIGIHGMIRGDNVRENELLRSMTDAAEKISSPYEKVSALLDIIPLAIHGNDHDIPEKLLAKAEELTKKINIRFIADGMRDTIARIYVMLAEKYADRKYRDSALAVIRTINTDEMRQNRLMQAGYTENHEVSPHYLRIKALSEKIVAGGVHQNQIAMLERLIQTVPDRGTEALLLADLAVYFRSAGMEKISNRMLREAVKKAEIIRPLSRRSFIMCDIALRLYDAGCERTAQEILDHAIDAATNIRQSQLRDDVFDELGLAIRTMQEMRR